jgi:hypothetical protein
MGAHESSQCERVAWCLRQVEHDGDCAPTFTLAPEVDGRGDGGAMTLAEFESLNLPELRELVARRMSGLKGDQDFMHGIAVSERLEHYQRVCGLSYPRAQFSAIAMTLRCTAGGFVR